MSADASPATATPASSNGSGLFQVAPSLARSPLGIIALFILLVYAIAGIVCATWKPPVPDLLLWFIVGFPVLVFVVFTWLVVEHHLKLYGPGDFADQNHFLAMQKLGEAQKAAELLQPELSAVGLPDQVNPAKLAAEALALFRRGMPPAPAPGPAPRRTPTAARATGAGTDDPQKGKWGGLSERDGFKVYVSGNAVREITPDLFRLTLCVSSTADAMPLSVPVRVHLHDSFDPMVRVLNPESGLVRMPMVLYGSFTVGVEVLVPDREPVRLELDLADPLIHSPQAFKDR